MSSDTYLRKALVNLRENRVLSQSATAEERRHCVLRRGMIDWLVAEKPQDLRELYERLPERLWIETDMQQLEKYSEEILKLVQLYSPGGWGFRR
jgi:hypothetical protein